MAIEKKQAYTVRESGPSKRLLNVIDIMTPAVDKNLRKDLALRELAARHPLHLRIQGDCMYPLLKDSQSVEISGKRFYWPGDVLVFRGHNGQMFIHRFLGCYPQRRTIRYLTKADTAHRPDSSIAHQQIIGKVSGGDGSPMLSAVPLVDRFRALGLFFRFAIQRVIKGRHNNGFR